MPSTDAPLSACGHSRHDHRLCVRQALSEATELCRRHGARLTEQRRRVLELVWQHQQPVGAYELLDALRAGGTNAAPPTVYRALEFLLDQGLIHRIESLNAYTGCVHPGVPHNGQFLVCTGCGAVLEMSDSEVQRAVQHSAQQQGFRVQQQTIEVTGLCRECQETKHE